MICKLTAKKGIKLLNPQEIIIHFILPTDPVKIIYQDNSTNRDHKLHMDNFEDLELSTDMRLVRGVVPAGAMPRIQ